MTVRDSVDELMDEWTRARPDLDVTPVAIVLRLGRIRAQMEERMEHVMARHGLTLADFSALAAIARLEGTTGVAQVRIMDELGLTSGTVSLRINRLIARGWATSTIDPADRRGSLVSLTKAGRRAFEQAAPEHLLNEQQMLSGLAEADRASLAELLRVLLSDLEGGDA